MCLSLKAGDILHEWHYASWRWCGLWNYFFCVHTIIIEIRLFFVSLAEFSLR